MSDQEQKQDSTSISSQPEDKKKSTELSEEELKKVSGGGTPAGPVPVPYPNVGKAE
jgi:bacteriocin-like protein